MKRFMAALVLVTISCLVYVYAEVQTFKIGYTIRKQEDMKTQLLDRARALKYNIARLKSPANLERRLIAQKVMLASPKSWQTIVMMPQTPASPQMFAQSVWSHPTVLARLFMGMAEAQAKESSN